MSEKKEECELEDLAPWTLNLTDKNNDLLASVEVDTEVISMLIEIGLLKVLTDDLASRKATDG